MNSSNEIQEAVRMAMQEALETFIGELSNENTVANIRSSTLDVLNRLAPHLKPRIDVNVNGPEVSVTVFDAETGEPLSVGDLKI